MSSADRQDERDSEGSPPGGLDLGLSEILAQAAAPAQAQPTQAATSIESAPAVAVQAPAAPKNEYEQLADRSAWSELCALCESRIQAQGEGDGEARLWWIKGQIELKGVPASILASLLDAASKQVYENVHAARLAATPEEPHLAAIAQLACGLLRVLGAVMRQNGEHNFAVIFFERAYRFDAQESGAVLAALADERRQLEDSRDYGRELETAARLRDLKNLEEELGGCADLSAAVGSNVAAAAVGAGSEAGAARSSWFSSLSRRGWAGVREQPVLYTAGVLAILLIMLYAHSPKLFEWGGAQEAAPRIVAMDRAARPIAPAPERVGRMRCFMI